MKHIFLLTVFLFQLTIVFGQTKTVNKKGTTGIAAGGYETNRQVTPSKNNSINYNDRAYQNDCYKNFAFTVKNYGYNKDGNFYSWGVAVKNQYSQAVQLKYKLIVGNDNTQVGTLTYYLQPGETYSNDFGKAKAIIVKNNSDKFKIEVSEVCFEGQDCNKNGYADCNGKQPATATANNKGISASPTGKNPTSKTSSDKYYIDVKKPVAEKDRAKPIANEGDDVSSSQTDKVFVTVQTEAKFDGDWNNFIQRNLNGNIPVDNGAAEGTYKVILNFIVSKDGTISDITCENNPGYGTCEEAIRVLTKSPKWIPAVQNGRTVIYRCKQSITFTVSDE